MTPASVQFEHPFHSNCAVGREAIKFSDVLFFGPGTVTTEAVSDTAVPYLGAPAGKNFGGVAVSPKSKPVAYARRRIFSILA